MRTDNYYVRHHGITNTQTKPVRIEEDSQDDGYSRMDAVNRIVQIVQDTIRDSTSAEIIVNVSANKSIFIGFGKTDELTPLDED